MPDRNFTFEIQEHFGVIGSREEGWSKELNLIRWNGGAAKYDIREWDAHHERMRKGVTLTPWEMRKLVELFVSRNNDAAVERGRAIEAERNARRLAARQKAEEAASEVNTREEQETLEGTIPPEQDSGFPEDGEVPYQQDSLPDAAQQESQGAEF